MGRVNESTLNSKAERRAHTKTRHSDRKRALKKPTTPMATDNNAQSPLPKMQDFDAVAPSQFNFPASPLHQSRIGSARTTMWKSMEGLQFTEAPFNQDEMNKLAAVFGFLADQPNAHDLFLRVFTGIFNLMLSMKKAYCNNDKANTTFFAFVRLTHYNALLGRQRGGLTKLAQARAVASLDVQLMTKVIQTLIEARLAFIAEEAAFADESSGKSSSKSSGKQPDNTHSNFDIAATALSAQLNNGLGFTDSGSVTPSSTRDVLMDVVDGWLSDANAGPAGGNKWPNVSLQKLFHSIDMWNDDKVVQKQKKQLSDDWGKMFGQTPTFTP